MHAASCRCCWQTARWKWVAHRYFEPKRVDESARHPGLTTDGSANASRTKHPINYLGQFRTLLGTHPLADNPFAEYPLFGGYRASGIPYLDQGLSGPVLKQLTLNHQSLDDALRTAPAARRGIHASDILEGRSAREVATFFETVDRACAPGSTLIFWDHRFRTTPPPSWLETWKPATPLPADRVPFYHSVHAYTKS
ncbi:MAG: BtaA family protein [Cryomorphaceae bacterium]|nr:BtaA family protein [Cryomorphaceae bacterium]